ncbi:hypothetical protein HRM2_10200 [Desulforapulum autotrophicum HRM2]|uniref:Uncharacterized protein n=1 Tax=Desulforapulum autotrophicum (strain ATCC 43914 / DSM 3382 / VKM B-1955 / HRM2) TaxID=177437 RepID=C0QL46_DESAH|nr:hypothetical protein HRM2_10200 [Desulforapulum autotrophicum HRM2]
MVLCTFCFYLYHNWYYFCHRGFGSEAFLSDHVHAPGRFLAVLGAMGENEYTMADAWESCWPGFANILLTFPRLLH